MLVILGFLIIIMLLLLAYTCYRFIRRKELMMLVTVCAQLFSISMAVLCFINNVQALEIIQACFLLFGIIAPSAYVIYDQNRMLAKVKKHGIYEGFIEPAPRNAIGIEGNSISLEEINPLQNELHSSDFYNEKEINISHIQKNIKKALFHADVMIKGCDYKGAHIIYSALLYVLDNNPGLLYNYANLCFHNERFFEAAEAYKKASGLIQESNMGAGENTDRPAFDLSKLYYNMGCAKFKLKKYDNAVSYFEKSISLDQNLVAGKENIALCYAANGEIEKAIEHYKDAAAQDDGNYRIHYIHGCLLAESEQYAEAAAEIEKCIRIRPESEAAYIELGKILQKQGQLKEAAEAFENAVRHNAADYAAHYNLASTYYRLGMNKESVKSYKKAAALKPDSFKAYYNMAVALDDQGLCEEAADSFKKAIEIKPDFIDAYNNLGIVLANSGRVDEALEVYEEGIRRNPDEYSIYLNMGIALSGEGRNREAVAAFRNALDIKPDELEVYYYLGAALTETGNYNDAITAYKNALKVKPEDCELFYGISAVYSMLGRYDIAFDNLKKAIELNGELKADARTNKAFDPMRKREDFREMVS